MFHSAVQFFKQRSNSIYVSNGIVLLYRFFSSKDHVPARYRSFNNWQKWKRVFLTCPCHEIDRDEAVGLKSFK